MSGYQRLGLILLFAAMFVAALTGQRGFMWALVVAVAMGTVINILRALFNV